MKDMVEKCAGNGHVVKLLPVEQPVQPFRIYDTLINEKLTDGLVAHALFSKKRQKFKLGDMPLAQGAFTKTLPDISGV